MVLARRTADEAVQDAGLDAGTLCAERTGIVYGTSKGGLHTFSRLATQCPLEDDDWLNVWPNAAARGLAARFGCRGPVVSPVLACATGLAACQRGYELIRNGRCDVVLAGSSDASLQPAILGSFQRLGVLARNFTDPANACRPFDRNRSGFVIGEGAGCLVMESLTHAAARHAAWYGEWLSGRMLSDSTGLTQLDPQGESLRRLLRDLQREVACLPDYVNLHGTGTRPNDRVETEALCAVLGPDAARVACSSLKGGLGHLLGAAGSVEIAATFLAIRDQIVPPTANLCEPDPELTLDYTPGESRARTISHAWKLSLGFGGHLSAACVGRLIGSGDRTTPVRS